MSPVRDLRGTCGAKTNALTQETADPRERKEHSTNSRPAVGSAAGGGQRRYEWSGDTWKKDKQALRLQAEPL